MNGARVHRARSVHGVHSVRSVHKVRVLCTMRTNRTLCTVSTLRTMCTGCETFLTVEGQMHQPEHVGSSEERRKDSDSPKYLVAVEERFEKYFILREEAR